MCILLLVEDCIVSHYNHLAHGDYTRGTKFQCGCLTFCHCFRVIITLKQLLFAITWYKYFKCFHENILSPLQGLFQLLEPAVLIRCRQQDLDIMKVVFLTLDFYDISTNLIITNVGLNLNSLLKFLIVYGLAQTLKKVVMSELLGCKHIEKGLF